MLVTITRFIKIFLVKKLLINTPTNMLNKVIFCVLKATFWQHWDRGQLAVLRAINYLHLHEAEQPGAKCFSAIVLNHVPIHGL